MSVLYYFGTLESCGGQQVRIKHSNGNTTFLKQKIVYHSPDGFQWGYGGSGPADLALNILYDFFRRLKYKNAKRLAFGFHQDFKWDFIAKSKKELKILAEDIQKWLDKKLAESPELKSEFLRLIK